MSTTVVPIMFTRASEAGAFFRGGGLPAKVRTVSYPTIYETHYTYIVNIISRFWTFEGKEIYFVLIVCISAAGRGT